MASRAIGGTAFEEREAGIVPETGLAPAALVIGAEPANEAFLRAIFQRREWDLYAVGTLGAALTLLRLVYIPVVLTEARLPAGGWKDVLEQVRDLPFPPSLVVTSRLADEHLWAEVLNWGGHDVLAQPLRQSEVVWVLSHAWRARGIETGAERRLIRGTAGPGSFSEQF